MTKSTSFNKKTKTQFKNLLFSNDLGDFEPDSESINEEYLERVNNTPDHVIENIHNSCSTSPALSISKIEKLNAYVNGDDNESCSKVELSQNNLTKEKDLGIDNPNMNKQCNNDGTVSMYFDKRKIRIAPRSSLQFKVGPPFLETVFFNEITSFLEQKTALNFELFSRIDRGFDFINDEWIGYKRNYFTLVSSFKIKEFTDDDITNNNFLIKINASKFNVEYFATRIMAKCFESNEEMSLVQHTAKRDKGPQTTPPIHPLLPSDLPNHQIIREASNVRNNIKRRKYDSTFFLHRDNLNSQSIDDDAIIYTYPEDDIKKVARYERVQFASSNTMKKPLQYNKHFKLISVLGAVVKGDLGKHISTNNGNGYESVFENKKLTFVPIALRETPSLIIRGRSPSNYVSSNVSSVNVVQPAVESFALEDGDMITAPLCNSIVNKDVVVTSTSLINVSNDANGELNKSFNLNIVDDQNIEDEMNVENICNLTNVTESNNSNENTFENTPSIVNEFLFDSEEPKIAETYTLNKRLSKNERKLKKRVKEISSSPLDSKLLKFKSRLNKNEIYNSDQYGKNGFKSSDYLEKLMQKKLQEQKYASKKHFQTMKNKSKSNKQARKSTTFIKTEEVQCIDPRISTTQTLSVSSHDSGDNVQKVDITPHMILNSHIRFKTTSSYEYDFLSGKENNENDFDTPSTCVRRSLTFPWSKSLKYEPSESHSENDICAISSNVKIEINNRHQEMLSLHETFNNSFFQENDNTEESNEFFYSVKKKTKNDGDDYNDENSHNLEDGSSESPMPPTKYVSLLPNIRDNDKTGVKGKSLYTIENVYSIASDDEMSTPRVLLKNQTNLDLREFKSQLKHKEIPKKTKNDDEFGGVFDVKRQSNNFLKSSSSTRVRVKINSTEKNLKGCEDRLYETKLKIQHFLVNETINDNDNKEGEEDQEDEEDREEDQCSNVKDVELNTSYDYNLSMCANYSFSSSIQIDSVCVDD